MGLSMFITSVSGVVNADGTDNSVKVVNDKKTGNIVKKVTHTLRNRKTYETTWVTKGEEPSKKTPKAISVSTEEIIENQENNSDNLYLLSSSEEELSYNCFMSCIQ